MSKRSRRPRKTNGQYSLTWEGLTRNFSFKNWQKIDDKSGPDDHDLEQFHLNFRSLTLDSKEIDFINNIQ